MPASGTPEATRVEMTQIVLPGHTNNHGSVFGGQVAAWIDICAAVSAQRHARRDVVTVSIDELHFLLPVRRGMIVVLQAMVNAAWGSSMEVGVRVEAEDPRTGDRIHCCSAYTTFVALDSTGRPTSVPPLDASGSPELARRAQEADDRRSHRLAMRTQRGARR